MKKIKLKSYLKSISLIYFVPLAILSFFITVFFKSIFAFVSLRQTVFIYILYICVLYITLMLGSIIFVVFYNKFNSRKLKILVTLHDDIVIEENHSNQNTYLKA